MTAGDRVSITYFDVLGVRGLFSGERSRVGRSWL